MDGRWRSVSDDGDEDLLQIPIPAGCQNGVSGSESLFLMVTAQRKSIWKKNTVSPIFLGKGVYVGGRRGRGDGRAALTPSGRGQGWAAPLCVWRPRASTPSRLLAPWVFWWNRIFDDFFRIFTESWISAQKRDTRAILLKTALVRVSCNQNTQIRGETIVKVFGKVDTF
jgi:hypothetical protein